MRIPRYLEFLRPRIEAVVRPRSTFGLLGHVRVERQAKGGPREVVYDGKNFIVDLGMTGARNTLLGSATGGGDRTAGGTPYTASIFRMAVGDGGTPASELFNPKLPDASWPARTSLFHEVLRQDISGFSAPDAFSMRFVGSFLSSDVDPTSYSIGTRVINEAALILGDGVLTIGGDKKQVNKASPDVVDADERLFSMRTFKSASFDPTENVTITVTWTITIAK